MKIIFDFDGTLIDSKLRLHSLFCNLVPGSGLTFDEYWSLKFKGKSNLDILAESFGFNSYQIEQFHKDWMGLIEHYDYLALDTPLPGVKDFLVSMQNQSEIYLCTARQFCDRTTRQIELLGFKDLFVKVLVTQQKKTKSELILTEIGGITKSDWIIGDMGKDVLVGKELGINTCAVLTGFMTEEKLKKYEPDLILSSVTEFNITR